MSKHCETANATMDLAIPQLVGDMASGRAKETRSFSQNTCTLCKCFVKKIKKHHAAAGESGFWDWHEAGIVRTASVL